MLKSNQTIIDVIEKNVQKFPTHVAYRFLNDALVEIEQCTYSDLIKQAKQIARYLISKSAKNKRIMLVFNPGLEFIITFFACLYAACIPVPCYSARIIGKNISRFRAIIEDADPYFLITNDHLDEQVTELLQLSHIETLQYATAAQHSGLENLPTLSDQDIAFLQYTSGSTANPKGVVVKHKNIMHNEVLIQNAFGLDNHSTIVGWLPFFHDMGLIGNIIQPVFCGSTSILMAPTTFLRRPSNWLETIAKYKAVCSGGPNFAYDYCVDRISEEELATLDLSSWKVAFNGSEMIQAKTLARFYNKFAKTGFAMESFLPCYGMAEATLFVSGCPRIEKPAQAAFDEHLLAKGQVKEHPEGKILISSGLLNDAFRLKIIDPTTQMEVSNQIGEICIAGDSVSDGYWRKDNQPYRYQDYFKTGDLGFVSDNQLFITGRLKELIIIRGTNYVPQDIEQIIQEHPALTSGSGACFSIENQGDEQLVIVQEIKRQYLHKLNLDEVTQSIHDQINTTLGITPHAVVLIKPLSLAKTSSGKIMRLKTKSLYLNNELNVVGQWQQPDSKIASSLSIAKLRESAKDIEQTLVLLCKKISAIELDASQKDLSLQNLGFDSVQLAELSNYLQELYNYPLDAEQFYQHMTFNKLLNLLSHHQCDLSAKPVIQQEEIEIVL